MTLKVHYALSLKTRASFGAHHENLNEARLYCQRRRCSAMTLDSGNIRFMRIFAGVPWKGGVIQQLNSGVIENVFFWGFGRYVFGTVGNEANIIIWYYLVPCRLSIDPKILTLNDLNGLKGHFYPCDAMLARVFAIATCLSVRPSVCLSVCHTPVLCLAERKQDREMYTI